MRGYTQDQILDYFERSYGEFVLLKPKFRGVNTLVWILPILVIAIGTAIVITKAKRLEATEDPYVARVRDLVGGKK